MSIYMLLKQLKDGKPKLENEYSRVVSYDGNLKAQRVIDETFNLVDGTWRGIGVIPESTLQLKEKFSEKNARVKYDIDVGPGRDIYPGCSCHMVIIGKIDPDQCPLFMKACTPEKPKGACMVSVEGTCRIWANYGSHEDLWTATAA
jgi:hydrogenase expression/formation protein HypD